MAALIYSVFPTTTNAFFSHIHRREVPRPRPYPSSITQNRNGSRQFSIVKCDATSRTFNEPPVEPIVKPNSLRRKDFPDNFIFGAATSAIQIEGNGTEGGRGPSTWDALIRAEEGRKGVDSYHLYHEDVKALKELGVDSYRFSISWPRILPDGTTDNINREGIDYYNRLLDELEENNITPFVTLFHFDMPVALEKKYNGFLDRRIIEDFTAYCDLCFKTFGKRVKHWIPINEASSFVLYGTYLGVNGDTSDPLAPYILTHNLILAHASAVKVYRDNYQHEDEQSGEIGMAVVCKWFEPHSDVDSDKIAAETVFKRFVGWYLDPLCYGDYPAALKEFVPNLPKFSEEEKKLVKNSFDFLGINYYITSYAKAKTESKADFILGHTRLDSIEETFEKDGVYIGPFTSGAYPLYIYAEGLKKMLIYIKENYRNPKMYITENGIPSKSNITMSVKDANAMKLDTEINAELHDVQRIDSIRDHLFSVHEALKAKVRVHGYYAWTLLDNMEFGEYDVRFGLYYVDYFDNFKRIPKESAKWYRKFLAHKLG